MKIYTKTGDEGKTGLFGGPRVAKDDPRINAYGSVDELNAVLGLARTEALPPEIDQLLARVQNELFDLGAGARDTGAGTPRHGNARPVEHRRLGGGDRRSRAAAPRAKNVHSSWRHRGAAMLHLARTVCRRAERELVTLMGEQAIRSEGLIYLNRLGDLLFVLARTTNAASGMADVPWLKSK